MVGEAPAPDLPLSYRAAPFQDDVRPFFPAGDPVEVIAVLHHLAYAPLRTLKGRLMRAKESLLPFLEPAHLHSFPGRSRAIAPTPIHEAGPCNFSQVMAKAQAEKYPFPL